MTACTVAPSLTIPQRSSLHAVCRHFQTVYGARVEAPPDSAAAVQKLMDRQLLVFVSEHEGRPTVPMSDATKAGLREYVRRGGRLLLLGFAAHIIHELGLEPRAPDRLGVYRWGASSATALGRYQFGFRREPETVPVLTQGLTPTAEDGDSWYFGGGEIVAAQSCHWEAADPERGIVLGRMFRKRDGDARPLAAAVLTFWPVGRGGVLAVGNLPEPWRENREVANNARQFLHNAVLSLCKRRPSRVVVCASLADALPETRLQPLPPLGERECPGASWLPHWGWHVNVLPDASLPPVPVNHVRTQILQRSYYAGADRLDLRLGDVARGYPFQWAAEDPLSPPATFRGGLFVPEWSADAVRSLALQAHEHGMQVQMHLIPELAPGGSEADNHLAMRWLARELYDVRRLGATALDGLGLHHYRGSTEAAASVLRMFHPGAFAYSTSGARRSGGRVVPVAHANHGVVPGLAASGLSRRWRDAFPGNEFPYGVLDCRTRQAARGSWPGLATGGAGGYPDWIVQQVDDFVRERIGVGAGLWWQAFDRATLRDGTLDYVHGVSMLPVKAAVAARLTATGTGGYRALVRRFLTDVQSGFGAEHVLPARTPFLRNNHFCIYGTGGALQVDPSGRAEFDRDNVAPRPFITTRWSQVRLRGGDPQVQAVDFVMGAPRGPQGYGPTLRIPKDGRGGETFPGRLSLDSPGTWPRRVEMAFEARCCNYVLEVELSGVEGQGIVEVEREGEILELLPFSGSDSKRVYEIRFPIARAGARSLALEIVEGGTVAIAACRLRPEGSGLLTAELPTEHRVVERAGPLAQLEEWTGSQLINERRVLTTIADWPGFVMATTYGHLAPGMRVDRELHVPGYHVRSVLGPEGGRMRGGAVLHDPSGRLADLLVVPVAVPKSHFFSVTKEGALRVSGFPVAHAELVLGFVWLRDGDLSMADARQLCLAITKPKEVRLGEKPGDPVAPICAAPHPRIVRVIADNASLYRIREGGLWSERGGQPAHDRGVFVHLYHVDQDPVALRMIVPSALEAIQPAPGWRNVVAVGDPVDGRFPVHVHELDPHGRAPAVRFATPFNRVQIDGQPWAYYEGADVFLPSRSGRLAISTSTEVQDGESLRRSSAPVRSCVYDPAQMELRIELERWAAGDVLFVSGAPRSIVGGRRIEEHEFGYGAREQRIALNRGALIQVEAGVVRVRYEATMSVGGE